MTIAEKIIEEVAEEYGPVTASDMKAHLIGLNMHGRGALLASIKSKVKIAKGETVGVAFDLKRYGIFIDKGAGRGYGASSKSGGRMNSGKRIARPWLWASIDAKEDLLSKLLVEKTTQLVLDEFSDITFDFKVHR
jgi:hypothetical protein